MSKYLKIVKSLIITSIFLILLSSAAFSMSNNYQNETPVVPLDENESLHQNLSHIENPPQIVPQTTISATYGVASVNSWTQYYQGLINSNDTCIDEISVGTDLEFVFSGDGTIFFELYIQIDNSVATVDILNRTRNFVDLNLGYTYNWGPRISWDVPVDDTYTLTYILMKNGILHDQISVSKTLCQIQEYVEITPAVYTYDLDGNAGHETLRVDIDARGYQLLPTTYEVRAEIYHWNTSTSGYQLKQMYLWAFEFSTEVIPQSKIEYYRAQATDDHRVDIKIYREGVLVESSTDYMVLNEYIQGPVLTVFTNQNSEDLTRDGLDDRIYLTADLRWQEFDSTTLDYGIQLERNLTSSWVIEEYVNGSVDMASDIDYIRVVPFDIPQNGSYRVKLYVYLNSTLHNTYVENYGMKYEKIEYTDLYSGNWLVDSDLDGTPNIYNLNLIGTSWLRDTVKHAQYSIQFIDVDASLIVETIIHDDVIKPGYDRVGRYIRWNAPYNASYQVNITAYLDGVEVYNYLTSVFELEGEDTPELRKTIVQKDNDLDGHMDSLELDLVFFGDFLSSAVFELEVEIYKLDAATNSWLLEEEFSDASETSHSMSDLTHAVVIDVLYKFISKEKVDYAFVINLYRNSSLYMTEQHLWSQIDAHNDFLFDLYGFSTYNLDSINREDSVYFQYHAGYSTSTISTVEFTIHVFRIDLSTGSAISVLGSPISISFELVPDSTTGQSTIQQTMYPWSASEEGMYYVKLYKSVGGGDQTLINTFTKQLEVVEEYSYLYDSTVRKNLDGDWEYDSLRVDFRFDQFVYSDSVIERHIIFQQYDRSTNSWTNVDSITLRDTSIGHNSTRSYHIFNSFQSEWYRVKLLLLIDNVIVNQRISDQFYLCAIADIHPPEISGLTSYEFLEGQEVQLDFTITDRSNGSYDLYMNGTIEASGGYTVETLSTSISISIASLPAGMYNMTIVVTDDFGNTNRYVVFVEVLPVTSTTETSEVSSTSTGSQSTTGHQSTNRERSTNRPFNLSFPWISFLLSLSSLFVLKRRISPSDR